MNTWEHGDEDVCIKVRLAKLNDVIFFNGDVMGFK